MAKKESKADICWITDSSLPPRRLPDQDSSATDGNQRLRQRRIHLCRTNATPMGSRFSRIYHLCLRKRDGLSRTQWRCFLLDSGRQFQKITTIRKYIDMASLLKMNYFHWHLTEGLGWRIEIKQYPHLTRTGGSVGKEKNSRDSIHRKKYGISSNMPVNGISPSSPK